VALRGLSFHLIRATGGLFNPVNRGKWLVLLQEIYVSVVGCSLARICRSSLADVPTHGDCGLPWEGCGSEKTEFVAPPAWLLGGLVRSISCEQFHLALTPETPG